LALGEPDVDAILDAPAKWFNGWRHYYEIEPWGGERGDLQAAYVGAAAMSPHTEHPKAPPIGRFLPAFIETQPRVQSVADQKAIFAAAKKSFERRIAAGK